MSKEQQKVFLRGQAKNALATSSNEIEVALRLFKEPRPGLARVKRALEQALAATRKAQQQVDGVAITEGEKLAKRAGY